ncbi:MULTISPECIES: NifB/NifX family molybdenum-iron cluster-binding protein [Vibrio]|uniref:NifB/NifX family molybdenum-iron cluster-binding protein n=1 Tax=Vibrio TaxID=662 RepID=UPI000C173A10|nr:MULTISPECIES: NifB/NifX family molybdenum-iron cluster-binding protein [Vibrio]NAW69690.1 hypothetical protein [Vibrio sp. V28_P6S34P95]NAX03665.1 hypothetical protein [Vibrio sp. V30_P3S12P165]NAX35028.1 hypothetical protein [Vibrio sp. V29_P1S30P107]NAX36354.1 hypothetical protein [Vibrio sp. V27_P1S3P104]NAX40569.1 hypothetical protein [Vibrio sp. V26_P1S5P106]
MIYAIPCRDNQLSNHFSKAPAFMLIDTENQQRQLVEMPTLLDGGEKNCGKKSARLNLLQQHNVQAVVVKNIGQAMLSTLFSKGFKVFAYPPRCPIEALDFSQLQEITDINYARPSPNKASHSCCHEKSTCTSSASSTKLNPRTLDKLQRIFNIHR